ncbi:MAG TPA: helix-turn-helix domain-containing protein, partial [Holophaga sp.]|nr:helix-turn-helix domain-containing protein [Holophaga sp.]
MEHAAPDTRTVLLYAALACFSEHGFEGTSMRMIAERAMRPLSLLSHHFGSKEGLYLEVFKLIFERFLLDIGEASMPEGGYAPRDRKEAVALLREQVHRIYLEVLHASEPQDPFREEASRLWLQEVQSPRQSLRP